MRWSSLLPALLLTLPAWAQNAPSCTPARAGQLACMADRVCACRFERGGSMTGQPDRWAWDCGTLRPACTVAPADLARPPGPALPGMMIVPQLAPPGGWAPPR